MRMYDDKDYIFETGALRVRRVGDDEGFETPCVEITVMPDNRGGTINQILVGGDELRELRDSIDYLIMMG